MSKIRTAEELQKLLDDQLVWRKRELSVLKGMVTAKSLSKERLDCYIRSGVALLYAHWEGFIKESGTLYLTYVASQKLTYQDLSSNLLALAMKRKLDSARDTSKATLYTEVSEWFISKLSERCSIPVEIDTKANLSSLILREIMCILGLDYDEFATKARLIDESLVNTRNRIAHGRYLTMDASQYVELHIAVVEMIDRFADMISNAASMGAYRRT